MTTTQRISLNQQIEAVAFAVVRQSTLANGQSVKPMRGRSTEEYDLARLQAAKKTLEWLAANEPAIRAALSEKKGRDDLRVKQGGDAA